MNNKPLFKIALCGCFAKQLGTGACVCLLTVFAAPGAFAQSNLYVNGTAHPAESGAVYSATNTNRAALQVLGTSAAGLNGSYSGTNITLSSTFESGNGRYAVRVYQQGSLALYDSSISTSGAQGVGVFINGTSTARLENVTIHNTGYQGDGARADEFSVMTVIGGSIITEGDEGHGINSRSGAYVEAVNLSVNTSGAFARGIMVYNSGTLIFTGGTVVTTGSRANGVRIGGGAGGSLTLNGADICVSGADTHGARMNANNTYGNGTQRLVINGGNLIAAQGSGISVNIMEPEYNGNPLNVDTYIFAGFTVDYDITITGGAQVSGTSALEVGSIVSGTDAGGDPMQVDMHTVANVSVSGGSALAGDINIQETAAVTVNLDHSILTGKSSVSGGAMLDLSLNNHANWNLTGPSKLTTLTTNNGSITIANVQGADLTVSGGISGQTKLNLTLNNSVKGQQEIQVVVDETNAMGGDAFSLGNQVSGGMQNYGLENRLNGAWLVLGSGFSGGGDAVLNTAAALSGFWFTQLDNLNKRMGELRYNDALRQAQGERGLVENIWVRSYGQQANIHTGINGVKGFSETQYGVDLGTDKAWLLDDNNTLYTGIFAGYGGADRDFHSGYNGSTDSGYGGFYGTWIHKDGWYADAVTKGQYFNSSFDGTDHGAYDSVGVGLSLELGRQFQFQDGWFAEPSVQVGYVRLMNDNYTTTQGMRVDLSDTDVIQFYGGARLGRNIKLNDKGWLQPYIKVGGLEQISSGGQVRAEGGEWRPNVDGARGVIGAGVAWQLDESNQLHLDYEASFGSKYDKPWGLNFGYRHQF
jgi:outer membrane autotransporter protein